MYILSRDQSASPNEHHILTPGEGETLNPNLKDLPPFLLVHFSPVPPRNSVSTSLGLFHSSRFTKLPLDYLILQRGGDVGKDFPPFLFFSHPPAPPSPVF